MENNEIIRQLKLTASLMELHNENPFKLRSYTTAAFNLEKFQTPLELLPIHELEEIEGVGKSMAAHIREIVDSGEYSKLTQLLELTPSGIIELLNLPGFGAKKIRSLWMDLGINDESELMEACKQGEVAGMKGFGEKSQKALIEAIQFLRKNRGKLLYSKAEEIYNKIEQLLSSTTIQISPLGELRRQCEVVNQIEVLVSTEQKQALWNLMVEKNELLVNDTKSGPLTWKGIYIPTETRVIINIVNNDRFTSELILQTGSPGHLGNIEKNGIKATDHLRKNNIESEERFYEYFGLQYIAPELREGHFEIKMAHEKQLPLLIEETDLKGILHNHSTYSDGRHSLRDMAEYCKELGYEYLGITDHSKSAFFARGMSIEKVAEQHQEIDLLNKELSPFKIFKGIESDILFDGSLDYPNEILETFDFVIASVHMILNMDEKKATERVITAVNNPYTTMLGHPTGRLLLEREGYPLDHKAVIDACAENNVSIEINANPHRLDLDWRWIQYALQNNVKLSINPDAHRKNGYHDMRYGLLVARKGGLTKDMNINSYSLNEIDEYFSLRKKSITV